MQCLCVANKVAIVYNAYSALHELSEYVHMGTHARTHAHTHTNTHTHTHEYIQF